MDLQNGLIRLRSAVGIARSGAHLFRSTGLFRAFTPTVTVKMARDVLRGRRGPLALVHLHALSDAIRPAVVSLPREAEGAAGREVRLSYGELEERIHRLTHALRALGVGPGDRVGVFLHNAHEYLELNAALTLVGGMAVQIGYRLKPSEVAYLLTNSGAKALFCHDDLAPVAVEAAREAQLPASQVIACPSAPGLRGYEELLEAGDPTRPATVDGGGYGGVMIYTSGTTGRSKGAKRDFRKMGLGPVLSFMSQFPISRDERHLVVCPLYHSMATAFITMVTAVGGCSVLVPRFDAERVLATIERERITSSLVVPTMLARILQLPPETLRKYDTSSLKWIMSGAAPLPAELARRVEDAFGPILYNFYGATETGLVTIALPGEHTARPGTVGRAVGGNEIRLLDGQGREVPIGEVGELYVRSGMVMDEYHDNPEATRDAARDGFISVGDLAWRDADGFFYLADRKTDMVISGGVNIYPWEIEQRLHEHPAVADAAVVGMPDPEWGESLAAFVVLGAGKQASAEELIAWVQKTLADYKRPRRVVFVDALPRNPTGKVLKRELKQRAAAS